MTKRLPKQTENHLNEFDNQACLDNPRCSSNRFRMKSTKALFSKYHPHIWVVQGGQRGNQWIIGSLFRHYSVQTGLLCQRGRDRVSKKQLEPPEHLPPSALFLREAFLYHCPQICGNFPNAPLNMELCYFFSKIRNPFSFIFVQKSWSKGPF